MIKRKSKNYIHLLVPLLIILVSIPFSNFFPQNRNLTYTKSDLIENNQNLTTNQLLNESAVWGDPYKITSRDLERGEYTVVQDLMGIYHCVWLEEYTSVGIGFTYSYSLDRRGTNWSNSSLILRTDADIIEMKICVDENQTVYLFYIAKRVFQYHLYFTYKKSTENEWANQRILYEEGDLILENLNVVISNNETIHLLISALEFDTPLGNIIENKIIYSSFSGLSSFNSKNFRNLYTSSLKLKPTIEIVDNTVQIFCTDWNQDISEGKLFIFKSSDNGENWTNKIEISSFESEVEEIDVRYSTITNSTHIFGQINSYQKLLYYLEFFRNEAISESPILIGNPYRDSFFGGIAINETNGNLLIIFEDYLNTRKDIKYVRKTNETNTWTSIEEITEDISSFDPIFIANYNNQSENLGGLFYLGINGIFSRIFYDEYNFSKAKELFKTTTYNDEQSAVIDSQGIVHLIWTHTFSGKQEILYSKKNLENTWYYQYNLTRKWWDIAFNPKLSIDSNDNLHLIFIAKESISKKHGVYYIYKLSNQNNWSEPKLVKFPEGYASKFPMELLIDDDDNLHIFWSEQTLFSTNKIIHSFKETSSKNFTSTVIQNNEEYIESSYPDAIIDSEGTIHLVYMDFDQEEIVFKVNYRFLLDGGTWSEVITIDASNDDILFEPLLVIDSNDKITLTYQRKYLIGYLRRATNIIQWEKNGLSSSWIQLDNLILGEIVSFHQMFILPNDTICYLYHADYISENDLDKDIIDQVFLICKPENNEWSEKEVLFLNPLFDARPIGIFDKKFNNLHFFILDKIGLNSQLNWITGEKDSDQDGLGDLSERTYKTNHLKQDTDNDFLKDGFEVFTSNTDPNINDTDWDLLIDGQEILRYSTNPLDRDSDNDKITDGSEVYIYYTDPNSLDSDQDDIYDYDEIFIYGTNPNKADSDDDQMPDLWELLNNLNPLFDDSDLDNDNDYLKNVDEYIHNSDPNLNDTDSDGLTDGDEIHFYLTDPTAEDTDNDTLTDSEEVLIFRTNPLKVDSDGDGFSDREEINSGTDPNNPRDNVSIRKLRRILLTILIPIGVILVSSFFFEIRYRILQKSLIENEKNELIVQEEKLKLLIDN